MKALVQRVREASVTIDGESVGEIGEGMVVLLGIGRADNSAHAEMMAEKIARLRIFNDEEGTPNLSLLETGFSLLLVSQFTLLGDVRKGNRPSFTEAAWPESAEVIYMEVADLLRDHLGIENVATGRFGATMDVSLVNTGPYTLMVESHVA
jgi:D-tyrosyl-tRNA(Tyr) deacylase